MMDNTTYLQGLRCGDTIRLVLERTKTEPDYKDDLKVTVDGIEVQPIESWGFLYVEGLFTLVERTDSHMRSCLKLFEEDGSILYLTIPPGGDSMAKEPIPAPEGIQKPPPPPMPPSSPAGIGLAMAMGADRQHDRELRELLELKRLELEVRAMVNSGLVPECVDGVDELEEVKRRLRIIDELHGDGRTLASIQQEIDDLQRKL